MPTLGANEICAHIAPHSRGSGDPSPDIRGRAKWVDGAVRLLGGLRRLGYLVDLAPVFYALKAMRLALDELGSSDDDL
jgi:hypothetical protein